MTLFLFCLAPSPGSRLIYSNTGLAAIHGYSVITVSEN